MIVDNPHSLQSLGLDLIQASKFYLHLNYMMFTYILSEFSLHSW